MLCSSCGELRSNLQGIAPRQVGGPHASDELDREKRLSAALPHFNGPFEILVGIGNPGNRYLNTPHNVGFDVVDALAEKLGLDWAAYDGIAMAHAELTAKTVLLVKPQNYVNNTGRCLKRLSDELGFTAEDCVLIQDDINLPLGKLRTRERGSDGGHKGVRSALDTFQTDEFRRLKIGVAPAEKPNSAADYLITPFATEAAAIIHPAIIAAADQLLSMIGCSHDDSRVTVAGVHERPTQKP
jgi:PTH1 family peptidyl-tRNA hydrolase